MINDSFQYVHCPKYDVQLMMCINQNNSGKILRYMGNREYTPW